MPADAEYAILIDIHNFVNDRKDVFVQVKLYFINVHQEERKQIPFADGLEGTTMGTDFAVALGLILTAQHWDWEGETMVTRWGTLEHSKPQLVSALRSRTGKQALKFLPTHVSFVGLKY